MKMLIFNVLVLVFSQSVYSADLGFRFKDGKCLNSDQEEGRNPQYLGQCGLFKERGLRRFKLDGYDLRGSRFENSELSSVSLVGANLESVTFVSSRLLTVDFTEANLKQSGFEGSELNKVLFLDSDLSMSKFDSSELIEVEFNFANLEGLSFKDTRGRKTVFSESESAKATFLGSQFQESEFMEADFSGAEFSNSECIACNFNKSNLKGADFLNANLAVSNFTKADLSGSDFRSATLRNVVFDDSKLEGANFEFAKLKYASFTRAGIKDANFSSANLESAIISRMDSDTAIFKNSIFTHLTQSPFDERQRDAKGIEYHPRTTVALYVDPKWTTYGEKDRLGARVVYEYLKSEKVKTQTFANMERDLDQVLTRETSALVYPGLKELENARNLPYQQRRWSYYLDLEVTFAKILEWVKDGGRFVYMPHTRVAVSSANEIAIRLISYNKEQKSGYFQSERGANLKSFVITEDQSIDHSLMGAEGTPLELLNVDEDVYFGGYFGYLNDETHCLVFDNVEERFRQRCFVFERKIGRGSVIFIGYSFSEARPIGNRGSGWLDILKKVAERR